jgi:hypothetical protein
VKHFSFCRSVRLAGMTRRHAVLKSCGMRITLPNQFWFQVPGVPQGQGLLSARVDRC